MIYDEIKPQQLKYVDVSDGSASASPLIQKKPTDLYLKLEAPVLNFAQNVEFKRVASKGKTPTS